MMADIEFIKPDGKYKDTYISGAGESVGDDSVARDPDWLKEHFEDFLEYLDNEDRGVNMKPGRVPQSIFWLIVDGKYVGRASLRHVLTDQLRKIGGHIGYHVIPSERRKGYGTMLLKLVLPKAKELGLDRVLVTCDETNIASKKIIEANGGVLENSVDQDGDKPKKLRYWITL